MQISCAEHRKSMELLGLKVRLKEGISDPEERENLRKENVRLRQEVHRDFSFGNIIGKSPRMLQLFETIKKISEGEFTILTLPTPT